MRKMIVFFLIFLVLLVLLNIVIAVPPSSVVHTGDMGLEIAYPLVEYIKQNTDFEFAFHLFNKSNGAFIMDNAQCFFHLYNHTGNHIYIANVSTLAHTFDYEFIVGGGNFSNIGGYHYNVQCNESVSGFGGFDDVAFEVTSNGKEPSNNNASTLIGLILIGILGMFAYFTIKVKDVFKEPMLNKAFMMFFFFIAIGIAVIALQITYVLAENAILPSSVLNLLVTNYKVLLWFLISMMFLIFIIALYYLFNYARMTSGLFRSKRTRR